MNFIDEKDLPVEIKDNKLPEDPDKHYEMFYDSKVRTSGGFADAIFLAGIMVVCFMWGMLVMVLG